MTRSLGSALPALREHLSRGQLVGDGAMGTMLQRAGLPIGHSPEEWNLSRPEAVASVHRAYRDAGSQILQSNTFGGSRARLAPFGLGDRVADVNRAAVALAREAAVGVAFVAGTVGPTGVRFGGDEDLAGVREIYAEQIGAMVEARVDLLLVETMVDLREARVALAVARSLCDCPVLVTMTFDGAGKTPAGDTPAGAVAALSADGADGVGANCGEGPASLYPVIAAMRAAAPDLPLVVQPSAGLPVMRNAQPTYTLDTATFAGWTRRFAEIAQVIGGCCGTTPEYIAAAASALCERRAG